MYRRPYTTDQLAQARLVVTSYAALCREFGAVEAAELRQTAWDMLAEDHAARLRRQWQGFDAPRDAA